MSGAAPSSSGGDAGLSLLPASLSPPLASSAPPTPLARLESHLSASLHHLWTSSLIVEQGVAPIPPQSIGDDSLERLMGMAHPRMDIQDVTNQNLQKQMSDNETRCNESEAEEGHAQLADSIGMC